jgi:hypothetical protein
MGIPYLARVSDGYRCPRCGGRVVRRRLPRFFHPLRRFWPELAARSCVTGDCGWIGFARR